MVEHDPRRYTPPVDELRPVKLPAALLAEIAELLEGGETVAEFLTRAAHQHIALREHLQGGAAGAAYFDQIGVLKPTVTLHSRDVAACALFYQRLGFELVGVGPLSHVLRSRGVDLTIQEVIVEDEGGQWQQPELVFDANLGLDLLVQPLRDAGLEVEWVGRAPGPAFLHLTDPDGRQVRVSAAALNAAGLVDAEWF